MATNVLSRHKIFVVWFRGLKDMSQKANHERDLTLPHPCYINKKVGEKGILSCYIGEKWRKMAEIG